MKKLIFILFGFALILPAQAAQLIQYDLRVDGMTCPFCLASSEQALKQIDGVERIQSSLETGTISVCGPASLKFDELELKQLFIKKGFSYRGLSILDNCSLIEDDSQQVKQKPDIQAPHEKHSNGAHDEGHSHD